MPARGNMKSYQIYNSLLLCVHHPCSNVNHLPQDTASATVKAGHLRLKTHNCICYHFSFEAPGQQPALQVNERILPLPTPWLLSPAQPANL